MRILTTLILLIVLSSPALARDQAREFYSGWHSRYTRTQQQPAPQPTPQPTPAPQPTQPLAAPVPLTASTLSNRVTLKWSNVTDETGYLVERRIYGGQGFSEIAKTTADNTTYTDILTSTTRYEYRVRAYKVSTTTLAYSPYTDLTTSTTSCE